MKYRACCGKICGLAGCEIQKRGGCYCVCRLIDAESTLISLLKGTLYRRNGGIIYDPNRKPSPLKGLEKAQTEDRLEKVREKIKEYEFDEKN